MKLFIDASVRDSSRTLELSKYYLSYLNEEITTIKLINEKLLPLNASSLKLRDQYIEENNFNDDLFKYAKLFKEADEIIVCAPYYDLSFPATLKLFIENITVNNLTFGHNEKGERIGLCKANKLVYITTSGGPIIQDYGYSYIKDLCENMYGIKECVCFSGEGLDMIQNDATEILNDTKHQIDLYFKG